MCSGAPASCGTLFAAAASTPSSPYHLHFLFSIAFSVTRANGDDEEHEAAPSPTFCEGPARLRVGPRCPPAPLACLAGFLAEPAVVVIHDVVPLLKAADHQALVKLPLMLVVVRHDAVDSQEKGVAILVVWQWLRIDHVNRMLRLWQRGEIVIDVGCGGERVAIPLADKGDVWSVEGGSVRPLLRVVEHLVVSISKF